MAAPASKTINDLGGRWLMNKSLSDPLEPALVLQGIGWMVRKTLGVASVTLEVTHTQGPPREPNTSTDPVTLIDIQQVGTAGLKGTREERCLDNVFRPHSDWIFGNVKGQSRFIGYEEIDDEFLKSGWPQTDSEKTGPDGKAHIISHVENVDTHWTATQIWGFMEVDGVRRYVRNIVIKKDKDRVNIRLVYDYQGPLDA